MSLRYLSVFLLLLGAATQAQNTIFVDASAAGAGTGADWTNAFNSLDVGLTAAGPGDSVFVMGNSTYFSSFTSGFKIPAGVAVFGGFTSTAQLTPAARPRNPLAGPLPGLLSFPTDLAGFGNFHVASFSGGSGTTTLLDGFIVHGGNANGGALDDFGGGLLIAPPMGITVRLVELAILNNTASQRGGGLHVQDAKVFLLRCHFNENYAVQGGGGISVKMASLRADDCLIDANFTDGNGAGVFATAILAENGRPAVEFANALFHGNSATGSGGGAFLDASGTISGKISFNHCTISANNAGVRAGGVFAMTTGSLKAVSLIENSILWENMGPSGVDELAGRQGCHFSNVPVVGALGCIYQNPGFVWDPVFQTNFDLGAGSPCFGTGNSAFSTLDTQDLDGDGILLEALPLDYANAVRPIGPGTSMGAYD